MNRKAILVALFLLSSCARSEPVDEIAKTQEIELDALIVQGDEVIENDADGCSNAECGL